MESVTSFDAHERRRWAGRASADARGVASLCAHPAAALPDAAQARAGARVLDVGSGTVAALALRRGAEVVAVDVGPGMPVAARRASPGADVRTGTLPGLPTSAQLAPGRVD